VPHYPELTDSPSYEFAEIDALRTYAKRGDTVVIVGAGRGITPTVAATAISSEGRVIAYEASTERVSHAQRTVRHNEVSERVSIYHKIVAKAESVRGEIDTAPTVPPDQLPDCDFLELDCEGAEELILEEMTISPRVISVETHENEGVSHSNVLTLLEHKGYRVVNETDKTDEYDGIRHLVAIKDD
jgi:predicted RNA methylase